MSGDSDPVGAAARAGILNRAQVAFLWVVAYRESHGGGWPAVKNVKRGVQERHGLRIGQTTGYRGLLMARKVYGEGGGHGKNRAR